MSTATAGVPSIVVSREPITIPALRQHVYTGCRNNQVSQETAIGLVSIVSTLEGMPESPRKTDLVKQVETTFFDIVSDPEQQAAVAALHKAIKEMASNQRPLVQEWETNSLGKDQYDITFTGQFPTAPSFSISGRPCTLIETTKEKATFSFVARFFDERKQEILLKAPWTNTGYLYNSNETVQFDFGWEFKDFVIVKV